jgi:hypothetical protein
MSLSYHKRLIIIVYIYIYINGLIIINDHQPAFIRLQSMMIDVSLGYLENRDCTLIPKKKGDNIFINGFPKKKEDNSDCTLIPKKIGDNIFPSFISSFVT